MYAIDVLDRNMQPVSAYNIYQKLCKIIENPSPQNVPFGVLTALHRDEWTKYYDMLSAGWSERIFVHKAPKAKMLVSIKTGTYCTYKSSVSLALSELWGPRLFWRYLDGSDGHNY